MPSLRNPSSGVEYVIYPDGESVFGLVKARKRAKSIAKREGYATIQKHSTGKDIETVYEDGSRRRNPSVEAAGKLSQAFHGRPPQKVYEVKQPIVARDNLAFLGVMEELAVATPNGELHELAMSHAVHLCADPAGRQLYLIGGDQALADKSIRAMGGDPRQDSIDLGEVVAICYVAVKEHLGNADDDAYHHFFGEADAQKAAGDEAVAAFYGDYDAGEPPDSAGFYEEFPDLPRPRLIYDRLSKQMSLAGGSYAVRDVGIVN